MALIAAGCHHAPVSGLTPRACYFCTLQMDSYNWYSALIQVRLVEKTKAVFLGFSFSQDRGQKLSPSRCNVRCLEDEGEWRYLSGLFLFLWHAGLGKVGYPNVLHTYPFPSFLSSQGWLKEVRESGGSSQPCFLSSNHSCNYCGSMWRVSHL